MTQKKMTSEAAQAAILRLSDPQINLAVLLASSPPVAKLIIETLPAARRLIKGGPEAAKATLAWLDTEQTVGDQSRAAIALYVLEHFPSEAVKMTLAKYISKRRFTGVNSRLAADTFLKAAGIEVKPGQDPVVVALREAKILMRRERKETGNQNYASE